MAVALTTELISILMAGQLGPQLARWHKMAAYTGAPSIKVRIPVRFPAHVTAESPLNITQTGANYHFTIDPIALLGGSVTVMQLKMALASQAKFYDVDNNITDTVTAAERLAWNGNGIWTSHGDTLSDAIEAIIGAPATVSAYALASTLTL